MLFSLRSIVLFSALIAASLLACGVAAVPVPSDPAEPVVTPGAVFTPDDCAVPALLVPGAVAAPDELAAPPLPPDAPPALWAKDMAGEIRIAPTASMTIADVRIIGNLPLPHNGSTPGLFRELSASPVIEIIREPGGELTTDAEIDRV
jgi:hypothetical protein